MTHYSMITLIIANFLTPPFRKIKNGHLCVRFFTKESLLNTANTIINNFWSDKDKQFTLVIFARLILK